MHTLNRSMFQNRNNLVRRGFVIAESFLICHFMYFCIGTADFALLQLPVVIERLAQ